MTQWPLHTSMVCRQGHPRRRETVALKIGWRLGGRHSDRPLRRRWALAGGPGVQCVPAPRATAASVRATRLHAPPTGSGPGCAVLEHLAVPQRPPTDHPPPTTPRAFSYENSLHRAAFKFKSEVEGASAGGGSLWFESEVEGASAGGEKAAHGVDWVSREGENTARTPPRQLEDPYASYRGAVLG
jgi:hypothetical protein